MTNDYKIPNFQGQRPEDIPLESAMDLLESVIELAARLGQVLGYEKIFAMQKYREVLAAKILGHRAHDKVSNAGGRGSDATIPDGKKAEYKSISDDNKKSYYKSYKEGVKLGKNGKPVKMGELKMVYNGAYSEEKILSYLGIEHFAIVFDENEKITLIVKVDSNFVVQSLLEGLKSQGAGRTTNLNKVLVDISQINTSPLFTVVYDCLEDGLR